MRTVEKNTGLRVDHYAEIGFGGFVGMVDAVGGVRMCLDRAVEDEKSGLDVPKGCQNFDGATALAFVRRRHQEKEGDPGRSRNQQKLLSALAAKAAAPGTALNPAKAFPMAVAGLNTLVVDRDTSPRTLLRLFRAMHGVTSGEGRQVSVPVRGIGVATPAGSVVTWDPVRSRRLFAQLREDRPVSGGDQGR